MERKNAKINLLTIIREKKDILFGKILGNLTFQKKIDEWKTVATLAKSQGFLGYDKDWKYLRDIWWQNIKRATLQKTDNSKNVKPTGKHKMTDIDCIVLDIIAKESPILKEEISEQSDELETFNYTFVPEINESVINIENIGIDSVSDASTSIITSIRPNNKFSAKRKRKQAANVEEDEMVELKKKCLLLEIYNLKLDALKKERDLNLPPSEFTKQLQLSRL